jgi:tetratricopeptide (TPR) repeat protein
MKIPFFKKKETRDDFTATVEKYRQALEKNPQDIRIHTKLAELFLNHGRKDTAISEYLAGAKAYEQAGKTGIATAIYKHILSLDTGRVEVYQLLCDAFLKSYLVGDAVEAMVALATHHYEHDRHYEAAQAIKSITTIDPENKFYKTKVEKFFRDRNLSPDALEKIGPRGKWTLVTDGGKKQPAASGDEGGFFDLEHVLDESSINPLSFSQDSASAPPQDAGHGAPREVLEQISALVGSDAGQDSPEFHYNLGLAFMNRREYGRAADEFQKAAEGAEDRPACYRNLVACRRELGQYDRARQAVEQALQLDGLTDAGRLGLSYELGLVCKAQGERKQALKIFKKIFDRDKNFKSVAKEIRDLS